MWRYPPSWRCDQTCGPPVTTWWVLFDLLSHQKWRQRTSASLGPKLTQRVLESLLDHNRLPSYCCQRGMVHVCRLKRSTTFYFPISVGLQDLTYFFFSKLHGYLKHCHRCFVTREKDFYSLDMLQPQWVCRVSDLSLTTDTWKQRTESGQRIRSWALVWAQPVITEAKQPLQRCVQKHRRSWEEFIFLFSCEKPLRDATEPGCQIALTKLISL